MKKLLFTVFVLLISELICGQVTNGLVGYFPFTEGSLTDLAEYQNCVLSANGDSTYYLVEDRFGNPDCAIDFQGAVLNAGINGRDITNEITVSLWMKTTQIPEEVTFIINKYYCIEPPLGYMFTFMEESISFAGRDNTANGYMHSGGSETDINNGEWHHIVGLVRSEGIWELWIDNQKETYTIYSAINQLNHYFCDLGIAGPNQVVNTGIYNGALDDIRFYNQALDSLEIDSLFNEPNPFTSSYELSLNSSEIKFHPNPFTSKTTIEYELKQSEKVTLTIYDYLGKEVYSLNEIQQHGKHQQNWNAEGLPAGVYFCVLKTREGIQTTKMIKF